MAFVGIVGLNWHRWHRRWHPAFGTAWTAWHGLVMIQTGWQVVRRVLVAGSPPQAPPRNQRIALAAAQGSAPQALMARAWQEHGTSMARTWQEHGKNMATAWQQRGKSMARAWQEHVTNAKATMPCIAR